MAKLPDLHAPIATLRKRLKGDVSITDSDRLLYSTDASIYQRLPLAVARPADREDCLALMEFAHQHQIALIPRAGGTSLAGQVVGEAMIVDVSRYMTDIIRVDRERQTALVQSGVILDKLNQRVQSLGLKFAPDPSTLNRCTISGIIGNNAWGAHAPVYGSTRNHVLQTELLLLTGDAIHTTALDTPAFSAKLALNNKEGDIYRRIDAVMREHTTLITERYPDPRQVICNAGYALHELAAMQPWNPQGAPFNLTALVCGSEGTLGLVTQAEVKLTPLPPHNIMVAAHFKTLEEALQAVAPALQHGACAVELLDDYLLALTAGNAQQARNRFWIQGEPAAVLLIEFQGDNQHQVSDQVQQLVGGYQSQRLGYAHPIIAADKTPQLWSLRRAALGLLMGMPGPRKAVSFIEDSAVPARKLPAFVREVKKLMQQHDVPCVYYGSVSMGLIHLRPLLNLSDNWDRSMFKQLADEVAKLLISYHGTISAKHGDGIVRSPYIETFLGTTITQCLQTIKAEFDPDNLFNPGKIVKPGPIDSHLRYQTVTLDKNTTGFSWQPEGLYAAAQKCNGAGACRKPPGGGTMCPSYMATGEELHSTRGRANTLRQVLQQHKGFTHEALRLINHSLQYCLSCKACRTECPANVDMARLKAECLHQTQKLSGIGAQTRTLSHLGAFSRLASHTPQVSNFFMRGTAVKRLLGFSPERQLPRLAGTKFSRWFRAHTPHNHAGRVGRVVVLNDMFSEYYEPTLGRCAVEMLERWGYTVTLSPCFASARLSISLGLLDQARERLEIAVRWLQSQLTSHDCVIGLEPSELLTYRDEASALLNQDTQRRFLQESQDRFLVFEEFVNRHGPSFQTIAYKDESVDIALHVHCHQKSLSDAQFCVNALQQIPGANIQSIASGCCGMAGLFGYAQQNHELSRQISELVLLLAVRKFPPTLNIVATGASCRQQILDFSGRNALHAAQIFRAQLADV